jgi:hypothetical protein
MMQRLFQSETERTAERLTPVNGNEKYGPR